MPWTVNSRFLVTYLLIRLIDYLRQLFPKIIETCSRNRNIGIRYFGLYREFSIVGHENYGRRPKPLCAHHTRKLCYRKDDRAMRPTYGCPENFRDLYAHGHNSQHFHGLLFRSTLWMFLQNLKSVALPVPEIIGGTRKNWTVHGYAHASFSPNF